ncbi:MAG: TIGR02147 family protein [Chitinispirillaceae bacterium]|nr:TIGR02147 family protein [Chitinispirillaceae bacterium]
MKKKRQKINIFEYVDYRFFLKDYIELQRKISKKFSLRSFAEKAGLAASLLNDILSKRQNLTVSAMHKYAAAMELTPREIQYFEAMVGFTNAETNNEKNRFFNEMVRLRGRSAVKFLDVQQYEYFSKWYHPVIRELMVNFGLGDDAEAMSQVIVPYISPAKIRKAIKLLIELGLVYKGEDGSWHVTDKIISSEYEYESVFLRNYHLEMLERAKEALDRFKSDEREFQGVTLSTSKETFLRIKERLRSFTDELLNIAAAEKEKSEEVYQINLQMFPFVRRKKEDEKRDTL